MDTRLDHIAAQKAELDRMRPLIGDALKSLRKYYDVELTYTSNAIEGNTLTLKIPDLMEAFGAWLNQAPFTPATAFDAQYRLTAIHPFGDGNGRTARLLMNLMLLRGGYPPVAVRPADRAAYLDALEHASLADDLGPFQTLMHERLDATLEEYLGALKEALPPVAE